MSLSGSASDLQAMAGSRVSRAPSHIVRGPNPSLPSCGCVTQDSRASLASLEVIRLEWEWGLFGLGISGALVTLYVATRQVVPEFRPLYDVAEQEAELRKLQDHILKTRSDVDSIQGQLRKEKLSAELGRRLESVLESAQNELSADRGREQILERLILRRTVYARSLGFLIYAGLGGVFAALLADKIEIGDVSAGASHSLSAFVIGATWMSYLSVVGLSSLRQDAVAETEAVSETAETQIAALRAQVQQTMDALEKKPSGGTVQEEAKQQVEKAARTADRAIQQLRRETTRRKKSIRRRVL